MLWLGYGLDYPGFVFWHGQESFLLTKSSIGRGAQPATCKLVGVGAVTLCLKQPACEAEHSFPSCTKIKIKWISTPIRLTYFQEACK
jgi:hypothetical protein